MSPAPPDALVLLVEDEDDDVFFMQLAYEAAGISQKLERLSNGQEAMDYLESRALPALIFLDLKLPLRTGFEVLTWMHEKGIRVPTIVLSTSAEPRDVQRAYGLCANSFLVKPASQDEFTSLLRLVKAYWLERNIYTP